ncbi:hypothetical protein NW249_28455 [Streptomyces sp. OUCMDZ-4982]|uniref:hypothetical protein n=1 Tax=Streptomyces sp. OUCMDZ-4982 TaxID=2973090 RepID=UPI00215D5641|nr:hypothetical protein [Streptomyces sp. OUCMDZ-4982]MCR8946045.1 hypothetical protein [Streptomyces sp. OUCMDZ-4982]
MRPARFQQFAVEALAKAPDVKSVDPWQEDSRPFGVHIMFMSGAQIWAAITATAAPGEDYKQPENPVVYEAPAEVAYPDLYDDGKVTPQLAEKYLAAALTNSGSGEIAAVYAYTVKDPATAHPGVGVQFHSEARIQLLFQHTARAGQDKGSRPFDLQTAF